MKRIAILIALAMVSSYMYGRVNSVWVNADIPMIFNDEDVDSIEYVMNAKGGYEQHLYSRDSVYVTQLTNDLVVTFDKHGVNTEKEVDMGLPTGTIWAGYNIGASSPEEYGDYYFYGDTVARNVSGNTYFPTTMHEIAYFDSITPDDGPNTVQGTKYDIAYSKWGKDWCSPTSFLEFGEFFELEYEDTYYSYIGPRYAYPPALAKFRGCPGLLITSSINGNRLFFPAAGCLGFLEPRETADRLIYYYQGERVYNMLATWSRIIGSGFQGAMEFLINYENCSGTWTSGAKGNFAIPVRAIKLKKQEVEE